MERAEGLRKLAARSRILAAALALAALVAGAPQALFAGHIGFDWSTVEAGGTCYSCHTLDYSLGAGAIGTSMINPSARGGIYNLIKAANGGSTPTDLGCVFCHNNPSNTKMKGVLNHFLNDWASKHPVGKNWNTGANTDHEYVSSVDASSRSATEIDCMDCHDATSVATGGSYVNHPGTISVNNPAMLKLVTSDGQYDAFCRSCHRSDTTVDIAGKGTKVIQLASHGDAAAGREMAELDGTPLKTRLIGSATAQCTKCHDTHYSSKVMMFNDGHEGDTPIVGDNCTAVCHYPGDATYWTDDAANNSYERHGHGKQTSTYEYRAGKVDFTNGALKTMNMGCASCHNSLDVGTTDGSRVGHVDKNPTGATNVEKYVKKFNIGLTMQDEAVSSGGNPILGICENCHAAYESHIAESGSVTSGCLDCHDEHAENSGPTSNVFMIPLSGKPSGSYGAATRPRPGAERVEYTQTAIDPATGLIRVSGDQYRADGMGVCDNLECHGATSGPTQPGPLSTFFSGGYHGTGGSQPAGTICETCHEHQSDTIAGSWSPDPAGCANCHDYPGVAHVANAHVLTTVHTKHADAAAGKGYDCSVCHLNAEHNAGTGGTVSNGTEWATKVDPNVNARVQVRFDTTWNPGVGNNPGATSLDNANYNDTTNVCSNTFCHGATLAAQGAATAPAWSGTLACDACHGNATSAAPLTSNSHAAHLTTATGAGAGCANCHTAYDVVAAGTHANGTVEFTGLAYTGAAGDRLPATGRGGCGTNWCHNNGQNAAPLAAAYTWGTAIGGVNSCTECHNATTATLSTGSHQPHLITATGAGALCADCHAAATVTTHGDGTVDLLGKAANYPAANRVVVTASVGSCGTNACHNNGQNAAPLLGYTWGTAIGATNTCTECHNSTTATLSTGSHQPHLITATGAGALCADCHAAATVATHGDGTVDLLGAAASYPAANRVVVTATVGSCGINLCHNNGQNSTPRTATYTWGSAIGATNSCTECHGDTSATQLNQAHDAHLALGATYVVCGDCHTAATVATHANGTVNITSLASTYSGNLAVTTAASFGSCAAGSCHNATAGTNIAWDATPTNCNQCHYMTAAAAGEDSWNGRNKVVSAVVNGEYTAAGHGKAAAPAINKACTDCHDTTSAAPHNFTTNLAGTNPYRLKAGFTCMVSSLGAAACHSGTTQSEALDYSVVKTHSSVAMGSAKRVWPFFPECVNCHDPHGDGSNLKMMQNELYDKATFNLFNTPPAAPTEQTNLVFTDRTSGVSSAGTSWADTDTPWNSLCQECHEQAGMVSFRDGVNAASSANHNTTVPLLCTGCHKHDTGFSAAGGCDGCHGDGAGNFAPDGSSYEDRAGAHAKHVAAIGTGNSSCDSCHPGNPPNGHSSDSSTGANQAEVTRMSNNSTYVGTGTAGDYWQYSTNSTATTGTPVYFKTLSGADDTDAFYDFTAKTCRNVNCHGSQTTPSWYPDTTAPAWSPSYSITASGGTGYATVSWNGATDASSPVLYDLYASTTNSPAAVFGGGAIATDITGTSAIVERTAGTWYFGVRAKDSAATPNSTSGEGISTGAVVTAPGGSCAAGTNTTFFAGLIGPLTPATPSDGAYQPTASATAITINPATNIIRQPMGTTANATAQDVRGTMPTTGAYNRLARFYLPQLAADTCVGPNSVAGSSIAVRSTASTDSYQVQLVDYDPSGAQLNGTVLATSTPVAGATAATARAFSLTFAQTKLAAGHQLVLEVLGRPASANNLLRVYIGNDGTTTARTIVITPRYTAPADTTPPAWSGGISNIAVTNPGTGGDLSVTWNTATDAGSPPVKYDVYRSSVSAADVWNNLVKDNHPSTNWLDTSLTDGVTYWYGVRAQDSAGSPNWTSNDAQTASATPTGPASGCTLCHAIPPNGAANAGSHAAHANSDSDYADCNKCHPGTTGYTTGHSDGIGQLAFDGSAVNGNYVGNRLSYSEGATLIYNDTTGYGTLTGTAGDGIDNGKCNVSACHGATQPVWGAAGSVACGDCHGASTRANPGYGDASTDWRGAPPDDTLGATTGNRVGKHLAHISVSYGHTGNSCNLCHMNAGSGTAAHADATASGNALTADLAFDATYAGASATYTAGNPPTCTNLDTDNCHTGSAQWSTSAPAMACTQCHSAITTGGGHLRTTAGGAIAPCTACHPGGSAAGYTTKHSKNANANIIEIPTFATVGITASPGIHLGGDHTATKAIGSWGTRPTTEAEMCWFCHDENGDTVLAGTETSEWGTNTGGTYNQGSLTSARWIGATWRTAQRANPGFGYKDGTVASVHTAMTQAQGGPGSNTGDTLAQIRCSYCHDVHDLNKAPGDTTTGLPYLRGQWKVNPYKQDGAPQSGQTFANTAAGGTAWGNVPRGWAGTTQSLGGYWIDQNSGSPANAWTADQFGGLCALCHGGGDQSWSSTEIGAINVFGTDGAGWVSGLNGHANSVKGGAGAGGSAARNIFNARGGTGAVPYQHWQGQADPGDGGDGFRGSGGDNRYQPTMAGCPRKYNSDEWNVDETGGAVTNNYHQFPCSKCHNPHASRLPRLMITNCLDTKHNTWDNAYPTATTLSSIGGTPNISKSPSNWGSAQNCHRLGGVDAADTRADQAGVGSGWNTVTPW